MAGSGVIAVLNATIVGALVVSAIGGPLMWRRQVALREKVRARDETRARHQRIWDEQVNRRD